eukprot:5619006-Alexandrium_andersonii.AAC.1
MCLQLGQLPHRASGFDRHNPDEATLMVAMMVDNGGGDGGNDDVDARDNDFGHNDYEVDSGDGDGDGNWHADGVDGDSTGDGHGDSKCDGGH